MRVLLLTTDSALAMRVEEELAEAGIQASMAVEDPDAIVLDSSVPDAAACAARLFADDAQRPIVLLTAPEALAMPFEGVAEVAILPLHPGELAVRLKLAMRRRRQEVNPRERLAATAVEDRTPARPPREAVPTVPVRDRGAGRPTKRERRDLERLRGR